MSNCLVFYRSGMSGGTATLSLRIGKGFLKQNYKVYYLYKELNDRNNFDSFIANGFIVKKQSFIDSLFSCEDIIIVLTYSLSEHIQAVRKFKKFLHATVLFYPTSNGVSGSEPKRLEKIRLVSKKITKNYFDSINKNGLVIYSGDKLVKQYEEYYNIIIKNPVILPLPIEVPVFNKKLVEERFACDCRTVVSFFRTDFPLKGYVFPLIRAFAKVSKEHNVKLYLIASGDKYEQVKSEIDKYSISNYCSVQKGCSYEELNKFIQMSYVNVGHGTSILDAAVHGLPTIVSVDLSYEDICCGVYGEVDLITGKKELSCGDYYTWLSKVLDLSYEEYLTLSNKAYNCVKQNHSLDRFINGIVLLTKEYSSTKKIKFKRLYFIKTSIDAFVFSLIRR